MIAANAGDPEQASAAVDRCIERFGGVDILVNNAATNPYMGPTMDIDLPRYDKTWEVNLRGALGVDPAGVEALDERATRAARSINVASVGGMTVEPSIGIYNATKAALIHLTRTMAMELSPSTRVNALAPGLVKTDMARALWEPNEERDGAGDPAAAASASRSTSPTPRCSWPATCLVDHRPHPDRRRRRHARHRAAAVVGRRTDGSPRSRRSSGTRFVVTPWWAPRLPAGGARERVDELEPAGARRRRGSTSLAWPRRSSSDGGAAGSRGTTMATTRWPHSGSGRPDHDHLGHGRVGGEHPLDRRPATRSRPPVMIRSPMRPCTVSRPSVERAGVAGRQPAVVVLRVVAVPVGAQQHRPAHVDLAVDDPDLDAVERDPVVGDAAARLGEPVGGDDVRRAVGRRRLAADEDRAEGRRVDPRQRGRHERRAGAALGCRLLAPRRRRSASCTVHGVPVTSDRVTTDSPPTWDEREAREPAIGRRVDVEPSAGGARRRLDGGMGQDDELRVAGAPAGGDRPARRRRRPARRAAPPRAAASRAGRGQPRVHREHGVAVGPRALQSPRRRARRRRRGPPGAAWVAAYGLRG